MSVLPQLSHRLHDWDGKSHSFHSPPTGWCRAFVKGCQTIVINARFVGPALENRLSMPSEWGCRSMARNSRGHFPVKTPFLLTKGEADAQLQPSIRNVESRGERQPRSGIHRHVATWVIGRRVWGVKRGNSQSRRRKTGPFRQQVSRLSQSLRMIPSMVKVSPLPSKGWRVELSPGEQPFLFPTKAQAISFALAWADSNQPCEVGVYGPIGEPERSMTFPNGNYRRPARSDRRRMQVDIPFRDRRHQERRAQV